MPIPAVHGSGQIVMFHESWSDLSEIKTNLGEDSPTAPPIWGEVVWCYVKYGLVHLKWLCGLEFWCEDHKTRMLMDELFITGRPRKINPKRGSPSIYRKICKCFEGAVCTTTHYAPEI